MVLVKIHIQNMVLAKFLVGKRTSEPPKNMLNMFRNGVGLFLPTKNSRLVLSENFRMNRVINPRTNVAAINDLKFVHIFEGLQLILHGGGEGIIPIFSLKLIRSYKSQF